MLFIEPCQYQSVKMHWLQSLTGKQSSVTSKTSGAYLLHSQCILLLLYSNFEKLKCTSHKKVHGILFIVANTVCQPYG